MLKKYGVSLVTILIFISRIPFLSAGYGSEEDAFGMVLTARNIAETGVYEYSRLPGHPVPELVYAAIYKSGPFGFNLLTALISTFGILFFMLALKKAAITSYIYAGLALAFTPVVFIASTNCMDYTWAMAFILISFYLLLVNKPALAGMALGIAVGCRITSGALILPFLFVFRIHSREHFTFKANLTFIATTMLTSIVVFMPVLNRYGFSFLDFYDTVYPTIAKAFYKFTIAVFGTVGLLAIIFFKFSLLKNYKHILKTRNRTSKILLYIAVAIFFIHAVLFWYLPEKAAFMIPAIPFILLIFAITISKTRFLILTGCLIISCFLSGINLSDPNRGGNPSAFALSFNIGSQQAVFDPLVGTVTDEFLKRKQRTLFTQKILAITDTIHENTAIISGWWLGDILVQKQDTLANRVLFLYYADEKKLQQLKKQDYSIYFLPDQDFYNDEKAGSNITAKYATSLFN